MIKKEKLFRIALILASVLLTVIGSEIVLRAISHKDIDGNVYLPERRIRPFQFPIKSL
jgi:hypothetical protein